MNNIFFISDTHFNHANILKFKDENENLIRPFFSDVSHMNEIMINNWNSVVKPSDKIYHLGDLSLGNFSGLDLILPRLNGKKRLILGNHDLFDMKHYIKYFDKIGSWRQFLDFKKPFVCTHYPLHPGSFEYRGLVWNVHGHIHQNIVKNGPAPDKRFINVCVEHINYTPVALEDLFKLMKE